MLPAEVAVGRGTHELEQWRDTVARAFVPLDVTPLGERFHGHVLVEPVADLLVSVVSASPHVVRRTPSLIRESRADVVKIGLQLRGRGVVQQDGRTAILNPGDLAVYDTSRPYELRFATDFQMLVLVVPRCRILGLGTLDELTAVGVSGQTGSGALTAAVLRGLLPGPRRSVLEGVHLGQAAVDLLAATMIAAREHGRPLSPGRTTVIAAQRYIEEHLADPRLRPDDVAAAVHVSVRHLQKLFEWQGITISAWARERRLEHCLQDLSDPRLAYRSIAAVGATWGLRDAAGFSRAFHARFGISPREHRRAALATWPNP